MDEKLRTALSAPFPEDAVKRRRGSFGKDIHYVDGQAVVARLNDCFAAEWSFCIEEHNELVTGEVLVRGKLTALGVTKEAFGKSTPAISRETGEVMSMADAYKAAATDALKKCATLLGVAAYLYSDDYSDQPTEQPQRLGPRPATPQRASAKQVSAIWAIGRKLGLDANSIRQRCLGDHGAFPEQLDKQTASAFIQVLGSEVDAQQGAA